MGRMRCLEAFDASSRLFEMERRVKAPDAQKPAQRCAPTTLIRRGPRIKIPAGLMCGEKHSCLGLELMIDGTPQ